MNIRCGSLHFRLMSLTLKIRDWVRPPSDKLRGAGLKPGAAVLDYGCGPGGFSVAAARIVGDEGHVYALDIHPLAVTTVRKRADRKGLNNITVLFSDHETGLPDSGMDFIILNDVIHALDNSELVLEECFRLLAPDGILFVSDHHYGPEEIRRKITTGCLFQMIRKERRIHLFIKNRMRPQAEAAVPGF